MSSPPPVGPNVPDPSLPKPAPEPPQEGKLDDTRDPHPSPPDSPPGNEKRYDLQPEAFGRIYPSGGSPPPSPPPSAPGNPGGSRRYAITPQVIPVPDPPATPPKTPPPSASNNPGESRSHGMVECGREDRIKADPNPDWKRNAREVDAY
jgi:hypothetical protein